MSGPSPAGPSAVAPTAVAAPLDVAARMDGARLLVMGGTGFLGKVYVCLLLHRFPDIAQIYLVVRPRLRADGSVRQTSAQRFQAEIKQSPVFDPLREQYPGAAFDAFLASKITPVPGDVSEDFGGLPQELRDRLRGTLSAFVNVAGVVDFTPPLDYALKANAFGMQNLVRLVQDLSTPERPLPFLHTSTCYVAGGRTGQVDEVDPLSHPFPKADELDTAHWSPEREIAECVDIVENVHHRAKDAFRQSAFLDQAKKNLEERGEPCRGTALQTELEAVRKRYIKTQLVDQGMERAKYWGWHNTYTYTKSLGEQILRRSGLTHTIVRPAIIESAVAFPKVGWCEGINTSSPMIYMAIQGPVTYAAGRKNVIDFVPVDQVAVGMVLALAELLEGRHQVVYQLGTSDVNPLEILRVFELTGLWKRRHYKYEKGGNPLVNAVQARLEPQGIEAPAYHAWGPRKRAEVVRSVSSTLGRLAQGAVKPLVQQATKQLDGLARGLEVQAYVADQFVPFTATHDYRFACLHVRQAWARLSADEQQALPWRPQDIDWRHYLVEVHIPGIMRNVAPEIEKKLDKPKKALQRHDDLNAMLDELAVRHDHATALCELTDDGLVRTSFRQLRGRALATAVRLSQAGVQPGDRVVLSGKNHPDWPIAWFGIIRAGAVAVPLDPGLDADKVAVILRSARPAAAIVDSAARQAFGAALDGLSTHDLHAVTDVGAVGDVPVVATRGADLASVLYTSGTTGDPKGVMLSHENFVSMLAALGRLFPLTEDDRVLSVLPLHHAFEFSCGLLLPLSLGARIVYLDRVDAERLTHGLQEGRITAMVGVPALWQLLERRIKSQVKERGRVFELAFDQGLELNKKLARGVGFDLGRLMFGTVHSRFGGSIRMLISGGAALPRETQELFVGLGLPMAEGYGLTEAAPVLTVAEPRYGAKGGNVGQAVPGVELRIWQPDAQGVGEVQARGPNVMQGYFENPQATEAALTRDGWLRTGDMGRLDHKGRLTLVGRAKEVVVTASGENIYLDDVEAALGPLAGVEEYVLVGLDDPRGGERLGLLARPAEHEGQSPTTAHQQARQAITDALARLPAVQRPAAVHLVDAPLPRTATRKIQRKEARVVLERLVAAAEANRGTRPGEGLAAPVARAIAAVAGVSVEQVRAGTGLVEELGYDSLMWVELQSALEGVGHGVPDALALQRCRTAADVVALVGAPPATREEREEPAPIHIPAAVAAPIKEAMAAVQRTLNGELLGTRVLGRAWIPQNRNVIVVANHTSHLDMGLVKYALGAYGEGMVSLGAQDYFFEGNRWKVAYFENLTNVLPLDRTRGFRESLRQATQAVEEGHVVLIFPEGTRQTSGRLAEFKPLVGKLSLDTGTDILPVFIDGAYDAMPKGAMLPRKRGITVRIGPPLQVADLRRLTEGLRGAEAARRVTALARTAVERLGEGGVLDLSREEAATVVEAQARPLSVEEVTARAFHSLSGRFDPTRVERPVTWYFSLGELRYTVSVDAMACKVSDGRPSGSADCVVKCSADMLVKMVEKAYIPEPAEFIDGTIKTSDIPLLIEFSRVFGLSEVNL
ncbi:AMP-binding protein [Myxococcota bacterium]|nr:AMP-binding protein [Myxococcota bacterium]